MGSPPLAAVPDRPDRDLPEPSDSETEADGLLPLVAQDRTDAFETKSCSWRSGGGPATSTRPKGSAVAWVMTLANTRAVDRVRSVQTSTDRDQRAALGTPRGAA